MKTTILFKNNTWVIEKISETEISISNGYSVCYAYYDSNKNCLMFDRIICPKYIQNKALSLAKTNIKSIY